MDTLGDHLADGPFKMIETPAHAQKVTRPFDQYIEAASIMALGHNVIIRGMNSIYRQAPHIMADDHEDFIGYARSWFEVLDAHHKMEEDSLFPQIEEKTGEKGLMHTSVEQHHAFLPGLMAYSDYLTTVSTSPNTFSGAHLNTLIDAFAPALLAHMSDEIPTLLSLTRFESGLPLLDMINLEAQKSPLSLSITRGTPFFFRNLDVDFEDGMWKDWPPMPGLVWWIMQRTFVAFRGRWWRFASCDERGVMRELPTLGNRLEELPN